MDRDKLAQLLARHCGGVIPTDHDYSYADKVLSLIAPSLDAAEEVSKFIRACSLNPFHGYATCARCFFRLTCAKTKSDALTEKEPT